MLYLARQEVSGSRQYLSQPEELEFSEANRLAFLNRLFHHGDGEREYAYDKGARNTSRSRNPRRPFSVL